VGRARTGDAASTRRRAEPLNTSPTPSPVWGLLFLHLGLSPVLFSGATLEPFDYPKSVLLQVVALVALAWTVTSRPPLRRLRPDPLAAGFLLFGISAVLSTVFSISRRTSISGEAESYASLPVLLSGVALFLATRLACDSWHSGRGLLVAAISGGAVASAYALAQAAGLDVFSWQRVAEFRGLRPFGTLGNPNTLACFLAAMWPIEVCMAVEAHRRGRRLAAAAFALVAFLGALAILRSASRAGWLALAIAVLGVAVVLHLTSEKRTTGRVVVRTLMAAMAAVALTGAFPAGRAFLALLWDRAMNPLGVGSRRLLWTAALDIFREHPLLGTGVETFGIAFAPRRTPEFWAIEWNTSFVRAHNEGLQVLATQGAVGALALLVMLWGLGLASRPAWRRAASEDRLVLGGTFVALLCFLPQMSFGVLQTAPCVLLITLAALVSVAASEARPEETARKETGTVPASSYVFAAFVACGIGALLLYGPLSANLAAARGSRLLASAPDEALLLYERATSLDPSHAAWWSQLGQTAQVVAARRPREEGRALRGQAREALTRATSLQPLEGRYSMLLCRILTDQAALGEAAPADALTTCERAIALEPANPYFHTAAVNSAVRLGDTTRARTIVDAGLRLYPTLAPLLYQKGFIALNAGSVDEAARTLSAAVEGDWHGAEGGREAARQALAEALRRRR
jgi:O-antigen ligase